MDLLLDLARVADRGGSFRAAIGAHDQYGRRDAAGINAAFLKWLEHAERQPLFAFLNFYDAHNPYLPEERFTRSFGLSEPEAAVNSYHRWLSDWQLQQPTPEQIADVQKKL